MLLKDEFTFSLSLWSCSLKEFAVTFCSNPPGGELLDRIRHHSKRSKEKICVSVSLLLVFRSLRLLLFLIPSYLSPAAAML